MYSVIENQLIGEMNGQPENANEKYVGFSKEQIADLIKDVEKFLKLNARKKAVPEEEIAVYEGKLFAAENSANMMSDNQYENALMTKTTYLMKRLQKLKKSGGSLKNGEKDQEMSIINTPEKNSYDEFIDFRTESPLKSYSSTIVTRITDFDQSEVAKEVSVLNNSFQPIEKDSGNIESLLLKEAASLASQTESLLPSTAIATPKGVKRIADFEQSGIAKKVNILTHIVLPFENGIGNWNSPLFKKDASLDIQKESPPALKSTEFTLESPKHLSNNEIEPSQEASLGKRAAEPSELEAGSPKKVFIDTDQSKLPTMTEKMEQNVKRIADSEQSEISKNDSILTQSIEKEYENIQSLLFKEAASFDIQKESQLPIKSTDLALETPKLDSNVQTEPSQVPSIGKRAAEPGELEGHLTKKVCIDTDKRKLPTVPNKMAQNVYRMPLQTNQVNVIKNDQNPGKPLIIKKDGSTFKICNKNETQNDSQIIQGSKVVPVIPKKFIPIKKTFKKPAVPKQATKPIQIKATGPPARQNFQPSKKQGGSMPYHSNVSNNNNNYQGNHVTKVVSNVTYPKNLEMAPRPMVKPIVPSDIKNQGQKSGFMAHSSTGSFEVPNFLPKPDVLFTPSTIKAPGGFSLSSEVIAILSKLTKSNEITVSLIPARRRVQNSPAAPVMKPAEPAKCSRETIPDYACPSCSQTVRMKVFVELNTCKHYYHKECLDLQIENKDFRCKVCKVPFVENGSIQYMTF